MNRIRGIEPRIAGAALAYVAIACLVATQLGTWTDEEYTLATTAHGPAYAFGRALTFELQAPLYFVLEAIWREIDASVFWARLPSILCVGMLFFALERIGRSISPERDPLPFVLLAAINPYVLVAGFEIRLYAFALLLGSLMWLLFDAGFVSGTNRRARAALVLTSILAIYVQYFLGFALVGFFFALLVLRRRREIVSFVATCIPIVVAAIPLALWATRQVGGYETTSPPLYALLRSAAIHPWINFIFPWEAQWMAVAQWSHLAYDIAVFAAFAVPLIVRPSLRLRDVAWIACAAGVQLTYLAVVATVGLALDDRHYVALYVPIAAGAYVFAAAFVRSQVPRAAMIFGLTAVLSALAIVTEFGTLSQQGDWRRVASYLTSVVQPNDVVVVYAADAIPALVRQYAPSVPIVPFPNAVSTERYSVARLSVHSDEQTRLALGALDRYRRIWFVANVDCRPADSEYGCEYVQPTIDRNYAVLSTKAFYGTRVEELSALRSGTHREETTNR